MKEINTGILQIGTPSVQQNVWFRYISEKIMKKLKKMETVTHVLSCRSFLTVYHDENDKPKFYGKI